MKKYYFVGDAHLGSLLFKDKEEHDKRFISWLDMACADSDEVFYREISLTFGLNSHTPFRRGTTKSLLH